MITPRTRSVVSFVAAMTVALGLVGCAGIRSQPASSGLAPSDEPALAIRFDNAGRDVVHVYLVGEKREWWLGRVEVGASRTLRIPEDALADAGSMQLVVLEGQRRAPQIAGDARAATTLRQPIAAILSQRWTFSQTAPNEQLTSLPRDPRPR